MFDNKDNEAVGRCCRSSGKTKTSNEHCSTKTLLVNGSSMERKLSRAEQVTRFYDPFRLEPLARFSLSAKGREGKAKKHPGTLGKHLAKAQPLKAISESRPTTTPASALTDCRQEDSSAMTCPSDVRVCLRDVMICDGVRDCRLGEDESPFLCMMRLWAFTLLNNVHSIFSAYVTSPSRDSPRHQSHPYRHDRSYRQSRPS
ncbi:hypothetical protein ACOMHN_053791 [Nucella lapillus]